MATPEYSKWGDPDAPGYYQENVVIIEFMGRPSHGTGGR